MVDRSEGPRDERDVAGELAGPLRDWLELVVERSATDLLLSAGTRPRIRTKAEFTPIEDTEVRTGEGIREMVRPLLGEEAWNACRRDRELDFAFGVDGLARFRGNVYWQRGVPSLALRRLPAEIPTLEELGVPQALTQLADLSRGLVLVTGPTTSGKSTTLAAMIERINRSRRCHIVTLEDPIEYLHEHREAVVDQRQVGRDTGSFAEGLRRFLRQAPDVVMLGEMRDRETIGAALTVAETGHLTLATLHTSSAPETVNRIIDVFPPAQQRQVRTQLALALQGVVTQELLPSRDGPGLVLASEVMVVDAAVREAIRSDKVHQIPSMMQTGAEKGMQTMDDDLAHLFREGRIGREACLGRARNPEELRRRLAD